MKFSIYLNAQSPDGAHDLEVVEAVTEQARIADRSGFAGVCLTEHHFTGYNTYGNPFTFGAYLAPQLENLHTIISVAVPALWNPLNFAEACTTLDLLTRGRCTIGVGTGGSPREYQGLGRDTANRAALMDEVLDVAFRALDKRDDDGVEIGFTTTHSNGLLTRRIMPGSFRPSIRFARAALSDQGILDAAGRGWALQTARDELDETARKWALYHDALDRSGHDEQTIQDARDWSLVQKMIYVGETDESALREVTPALDYLDASTAKAFQGAAGAAKFRNSVVGVAASDRDAFVRKAMIVGSADTVAREIAAHAERGIGHLALVFLYGQMDPALGNRSLQRFIDHVMPRFANTSPAVPVGVAS
ncbi:LLM class flavin-dependent oxidoreductase [Amycolatopsis sp. NPDC001319]|uniref:LLM class flavin-dependent oxidoreductase n=1 Tax=unclassified Amycolatopsis TaxID=2618356 RepID=UPI00368016A6